MPVSQVPFAGISNPVDFRNIVINGDMQIAQRNTSVASLTSTAYTYPTLDRWFFSRTADCGTWTMSQSTDVPSGYGFANSLKLDCTATASVSNANTDLRIIQKFEGQNLQYLKYGTANAQSTTLSFWVKSTKTGTFIAELNSKDSRSISKSYTVSVTNTWEYKTITFAGDTSGVIDNDNSEELSVIFWLVAGSTFTSGTLNTSWASMTNANRAVGQVNIGDSTSNDWLITGVQLEAGEQASGFEFMPIDVNLARCQRYYQFIGAGNNYSAIGGAFDTGICNATSYNTVSAYGVLDFTTTMRSAPSLDQVTGTDYYRYYNANDSTDFFDSFNLAGATSTKRAIFNNADAMTISTGQAGWFAIVNDASYVALNSEL